MKIKFTELNSGYRGEKKVERPRRSHSVNKRKDKTKIIIAATLLCAFLFTFLLNSVGIVPLDALLLKAVVSISGENDNIPIKINTDSVLRQDLIGDNIIVLTTDNIFIYSPNGKELLVQNHTFTKPSMTVNGEHCVVFDRKGKGFMLIDKDEVKHTGETEKTIITAQYGENGTYAFSTKADGATSALTVFNILNEKVFSWNCGYEYITSIALSNNGKYIGAAVLGAENGEIFTKVHYFGVDYKEEINSQKIKGVSPLELSFTSSNILTLVSDGGVYTINKKAEDFESPLTYYSSEFNSCDINEEGKFVVTIAKYGSENVFETMLFSKKGVAKKTISTDFEIKDTRITYKYIFILGENKINVYNFSGKLVSEIKFKGEALGMLPTDDFVFISFLNKLSRCFSYGNSTVEI